MTDRAVQPEAPTTKAGRVLLEQEAYNSRSFPLITVEAIVAIEAEARAASQPLAQERPQPERRTSDYHPDELIAFDPRPTGHPRTYSLVGTPHRFLVTDDESGRNIGYADEIGGPLVSGVAQERPPIDVVRLAKAMALVYVTGHPIHEAVEHWESYRTDATELIAAYGAAEELDD
jgi:hypothetical protein